MVRGSYGGVQANVPWRKSQRGSSVGIGKLPFSLRKNRGPQHRRSALRPRRLWPPRELVHTLRSFSGLAGPKAVSSLIGFYKTLQVHSFQNPGHHVNFQFPSPMFRTAQPAVQAGSWKEPSQEEILHPTDQSLTRAWVAPSFRRVRPERGGGAGVPPAMAGAACPDSSGSRPGHLVFWHCVCSWVPSPSPPVP